MISCTLCRELLKVHPERLPSAVLATLYGHIGTCPHCDEFLCGRAAKAKEGMAADELAELEHEAEGLADRLIAEIQKNP
jgi:hypothetical protein